MSPRKAAVETLPAHWALNGRTRVPLRARVGLKIDAQVVSYVPSKVKHARDSAIDEPGLDDAAGLSFPTAYDGLAALGFVGSSDVAARTRFRQRCSRVAYAMCRAPS